MRLRPARALVLGCMPLAVAAVIWPAGTAAGKPAPPFSISPVQAHFVSQDFETTYGVTLREPQAKRVAAPAIAWTLHLEVVPGDARKPSPGLPGSGAAVDPGCTNNGVGVDEPFEGRLSGSSSTVAGDNTRYVYSDAFVWHHPDAADSDPPGRYHCNHEDMGPHGHQGLITVTVTADGYRCVAHYYGTNTGKGSDADQRPGGEPTCRFVP